MLQSQFGSVACWANQQAPDLAFQEILEADLSVGALCIEFALAKEFVQRWGCLTPAKDELNQCMPDSCSVSQFCLHLRLIPCSFMLRDAAAHALHGKLETKESKRQKLAIFGAIKIVSLQ